MQFVQHIIKRPVNVATTRSIESSKRVQIVWKDRSERSEAQSVLIYMEVSRSVVEVENRSELGCLFSPSKLTSKDVFHIISRLKYTYDGA